MLGPADRDQSALRKTQADRGGETRRVDHRPGCPYQSQRDGLGLLLGHVRTAPFSILSSPMTNLFPDGTPMLRSTAWRPCRGTPSGSSSGTTELRTLPYQALKSTST